MDGGDGTGETISWIVSCEVKQASGNAGKSFTFFFFFKKKLKKKCSS